MKVTCVQENLNKALIHSSRIISVRSSLPILDNILVSTDQGRLKISATDLELGINYWIGAKIEKDGSIAIPSRLITEFISNIKEDKINISVDNNNVLIEGEKYNATIKGVNAEDFPSIPDISEEYTFTVTSRDLMNAINQVAFAAAADNTRPILSGIFFKIEKDILKIVATDSYRLAEEKVKITKNEKTNKSFIVPTRTINEVGKILKDAGEKVDISYDENQILFNFGSIHLVSRLIDGQYPNYEQIIPAEFENEVIVDKQELFNVCKVASLFARESANSIKVNVSFEKGKEKDEKGILSIIGQGVQVGESVSKIPVKSKGKEIEVSFNAKYILDVLSAIPEKNVEIKFSGANSAGLIKGEGKNDYLYIIMPLRN
ncbi:MAG TPA: DNA polymerase III subunit beta [Patescibacteria group bacterium]|nr:DNA polymerase III subunit beta [Patescibacteria group bacterium]